MANDIELNSGSGGAIIATDITSSSEHHQKVKVVYGTTGTFNMVSTSLPFPVVSASSGVIQISQVTSSGQSTFLVFTTGGVTVSNITTAASNLKGYMLFNSSATPYSVKVYNSTNPSAGSTTAMVLTVMSPGSTGGAGANFAFQPPGPYSSNGWSIIPTGNLNATSTSAAPADQAINFTYQT